MINNKKRQKQHLFTLADSSLSRKSPKYYVVNVLHQSTCIICVYIDSLTSFKMLSVFVNTWISTSFSMRMIHMRKSKESPADEKHPSDDAQTVWLCLCPSDSLSSQSLSLSLIHCPSPSLCLDPCTARPLVEFDCIWVFTTRQSKTQWNPNADFQWTVLKAFPLFEPISKQKHDRKLCRWSQNVSLELAYDAK